MTQELKHKTLAGVGWNGLTNLTKQALQFVFGVVLARALSPDDFGLLALTGFGVWSLVARSIATAELGK